ncbi:hypothetical protein NBZ79_03565 [Sneathiella marina]|uniref:Amidase n=1 Tax=Sneathiella marina TaxID=2950108 RepID=A0ABY4W4D0_9PROT|nr:hypothetical protein [Sneathiella marina]USG62052.1 hypothetical protein NBZ79_03565 [Sneathiella marina]
MTTDGKSPKNNKEKLQAEKAARLANQLRGNLRKRKSLQRQRGEEAPDAIKNKDRLTD